MTKLKKLIQQILKNPHKVKAVDFEKYLLDMGFKVRKGDDKKTHRHYHHPSRPELLIVIVFSDGERTILNKNYIKRYLKEVSTLL